MTTLVGDHAIATARGTGPALAGLSLSVLLSSLGISIANVALPALTQALDASFQAVQWVVLAYLLAVTALVVGAGRLGDIVGRRRLLLIGIAVFTAASLACATAPSVALLIAARAAQGLGAAIMMALAMALVGDTLPKDATGRAMGLLGTMSAIGTALGPSLGGLLIAAFGWRAIFLVNLPLGLMALVLALRLPADRVQGGTAAPLIRLSILREPALRAGLAMSLLVSTVMMATLVVGPFYLSRALGLDAALVGLVVSAGPVVAALTGVPAGRMADRFGAARMTVAGLIAVAAGALLLAALPPLGIAGYVAPLVVTTAGYALFQTANNTAVMADVAAGERGMISGMLNLSRNLGLVTGASAMGAVFALAAGDIADPQAVAFGMRVTFAVAAALGLAALALGVRR